LTPFVDIHTHYSRNSHTQHISILNNRFLFDKEIKTDALFSVGIHPFDTNVVTENDFTELEKLVAHQKCYAIGECGLDKFINIHLNQQSIIFKKQLRIALKYNKPVIIHCVKAFDELINLCKPFMFEIPIIIHGFNKSTKLAKQLIEQGFYISLNHIIFHKENFDITELPINKIFFETDDHADLSIESIYKTAAIKLKTTDDELKEKIYRNFNHLLYDITT
jgi:TatD DNase family protein